MPAHPTTLAHDSPSAVEVSSAGLDRAAAILEAAVGAGEITAGTMTVVRRNTIILSRGYGRLRPEEGAPTVSPDSVFLLASITKPVTACAVMILVDRGELSLDDPVSRYIPEFRGWDRTAIHVRHLLSHTSGLPDMLPRNTELRRAHASLSAFVEGAVHARLLFHPDTDFRYQSKGILLAAEIVERVSGKRLRDFEEEEIFAPLGMAHSALGLGGMEIADTVWCGTSMKEDEDDRRFGANSPYWRDMGHPWGGMHSSAPDLAVLLQMMLNAGEYGRARILSPAAVEAMVSDRNQHLRAPWGLGWALRDSRVWNYFGELVSPDTFGHVGATGTVAWADPGRQLSCVILTNQMVGQGHLLRRISNAVAASVDI